MNFSTVSGAPVLTDAPGRGPSPSPNEESAEARPGLDKLRLAEEHRVELPLN
jgi:hypothetical protein